MRTIQAKLSIATGLAVLSAIAILTAVSAYTAYVTAVETASAKALVQARLNGKAVTGGIEGALYTARAMAQMFAGAKSDRIAQPLSREQVVIMLEEVALRNSGFPGTYTAWGPGAFDGKDAEYAGTKGHDATGRLLPYLARGVTGLIGQESLVDLENHDRGPLESARASTTYVQGRRCRSASSIPCPMKSRAGRC